MSVSKSYTEAAILDMKFTYNHTFHSSSLIFFFFCFFCIFYSEHRNRFEKLYSTVAFLLPMLQIDSDITIFSG